MASPNAQLILLAVAATAAALIAIRIVMSMIQRNPEKRERRRRVMLNTNGRLGDGFITDASDTVIYYSYSVHGVQYETSQDVSLLRDKLPEEPQRLIGYTNLKYAMNNPGNSILLCEEWSGLRAPVTLAASLTELALATGDPLAPPPEANPLQ